MAERLGEAVLELRTDDRKYTGGVNRAHGQARRLDAGLQKTTKSSTALGGALGALGGRLGAAGRGLAVFAGGSVGATAAVAALTAVLFTAIRDAREFGKAMAEVSTLLPDTADIDRLKSSTSALAIAYGTANTEQAKALYQVISAGAGSAAEAVATLDAANKLAVAGVTSVETAVDGLTTVMNAYGGEAGSATDVSDAMFVAMRAGKTTIGELSAALGVVAPLAANAGVSFEELLAAAVALTKQGISTKESMTGVRAILAAILRPSKEAQDEAAALGLEFNAAGLRARGFAGFLQDLREKTGGSTAALARLLGGVEALVPAMALVGAGAEDVAATLDDMENKAGATETGFEKMAAEADLAMKRAGAAVESLTTRIGGELLPALTLAANAFADLFGDGSIEAEIADKREEIEALREEMERMRRFTPEAARPGHLPFDIRQRRLAILERQLQVLLAQREAVDAQMDSETFLSMQQRRRNAESARALELVEMEADARKAVEEAEKDLGDAREDARKFLERANADFLAATGQEIALIEARRDADFKALEESAASAEEKAVGRVRIAQTAEALITAVVEREAEQRKRFAEAAAARASAAARKAERESQRDAAAKTRARENALSLLDGLTDQMLQATGEQIALIERRREADLAAIDAAALNDAQKAQARVAANAKAAADIAEVNLRQRQEDAETAATAAAMLSRIEDAWLGATDRQIELIEKRRDADLAALDTIVASEEQIARARVRINERAQAEIERLTEDSNKKLADMIDGWADDAIDSIADLAQGGEFSFKKMANAIIGDLIRIQLKLALLEATGGKGLGASLTQGLPANAAGGGLFGALGGIVANLFHRGGRVGVTPAPTRLVPPGVFANAPRMHGGGPVLGPREVPVIAQQGERILPAGAAGGDRRAMLDVNLRIDPDFGNGDPFRRTGQQLAEGLAARILPILEGM